MDLYELVPQTSRVHCGHRSPLDPELAGQDAAALTAPPFPEPAALDGRALCALVRPAAALGAEFAGRNGGSDALRHRTFLLFSPGISGTGAELAARPVPFLERRHPQPSPGGTLHG